ncbi:MAG: nuclear transport factor 2 family protein [Pseudonocardiales bacterium]
MAQSDSATEPGEVLSRLQDATNAHDIDAIVACFAPDYRNETPLHPARSFIGNEQVRRNWTQILPSIPDLSVRVVASAVVGETVWSEWEHRGTRQGGSTHLMRGVIVFTVGEGVITSARFFLEPVDEGDTGVDAAVRGQVTPGSAP